jgi:hypothetical protein
MGLLTTNLGVRSSNLFGRATLEFDIAAEYNQFLDDICPTVDDLSPMGYILHS